MKDLNKGYRMKQSAKIASGPSFLIKSADDEDFYDPAERQKALTQPLTPSMGPATREVLRNLPRARARIPKV
jgi:hypothetical protein